jgi:hypothetical protein
MPRMMPEPAPQNLELALAQAQASLAAGRFESARSIAAAALEAAPGHPQARLVLANTALASGDLDTAITFLQQLCQDLGGPPPLRRGLASALNARGCRHRKAGDETAALADFEAALAAFAEQPQAGFNRALALRALGRSGEAAEALDQHLGRFPQDLEAALQRALLRGPQGAPEIARLLEQADADQLPVDLRIEAAIASDRPLLGLDLLPACPAERRAHWAWELGERLRLDNLAEPARRAHAAALDLPRPPLRAALAAALSAPPIAASCAAEAEEHARIEAALAALGAEWPMLMRHAEPALRGLAYSPFFLGYQHDHAHRLHARIGDLVSTAARAQQPALADPLRCRHPRRVLLVGSVFRDCTAGAYFGGWIGWLRAAGFEVVVYQLGPGRDAESERLAALAHRFHFIEAETPLESLAQRLRDEGAALLLYPELGMDARLLPLAALRLAARQASAWGHPVSPGFDSLDAHFSCSEMEPPAASEHYREPLRLLPGLGVDYRRPALPAAASRRELGLPERGPLVLVPQSLFKLRADNDAVYADLLQRLPSARLLLFADRPGWQQALLRRFSAAGIDLSRLHWQPQCSRARYLQINVACDLMLDSLHFSGGNASLDALQVGLPVLGCPGAMMRGRQSAAMLARLGLSAELCVDTPQALAARAAELLQSGALPMLRQRIGEALPALFEADMARARFIEHIENLCAQGAAA